MFISSSVLHVFNISPTVLLRVREGVKARTLGEGGERGRYISGNNINFYYSIVDTIRTHITVPIIEVSLIHWGISLYTIGTQYSVPIIERSVLITEVCLNTVELTVHLLTLV